LVALGRRDEVALTLWRQDGFEVPWHDVRLIPRAAWWFEIAQVPPGTRYADAEAAQQVGRASPGQWPMGRHRLLSCCRPIGDPAANDDEEVIVPPRPQHRAGPDRRTFL